MQIHHFDTSVVQEQVLSTSHMINQNDEMLAGMNKSKVVL